MIDAKRIKTVCTIGPSSWDSEILRNMHQNGMNVARINNAYADNEELERVGNSIREISGDIALMLDIKGHEIRLNKFDYTKEIKPGDIVEIGNTTNDLLYPATYLNLFQDLQPGQKMIIDKGEVELELLEIRDGKMMCKVIYGEKIESGKGLSLPGVKLNNPTLTDKDIDQIKYAIDHNWDFISASYIRSKNDIDEIRSIIGNSYIGLIAKIEDQTAVDNIDQILANVDGIMVARGDLGTEMPFEKLTIVQKQLVRKCNMAAKPVIIATNMLESMTLKLFPTRAEITDVANAVLDGADALMTSSETTTGKHPVQEVHVMSRIAIENQKYIKKEIPISFQMEDSYVAIAISNAAYELVNSLSVDKILVYSRSGFFARLLSRFNLPVEIYSMVPNIQIKRRLALTKGVKSFVFDEEFTDRDESVNGMLRFALKNDIIRKHDRLLLLGRALYNIQSNSGYPNIFEYIDMNDIHESL